MKESTKTVPWDPGTSRAQGSPGWHRGTPRTAVVPQTQAEAEWRLQGETEPVGGQGWKDSYSAWRECEATLLSEKLEQRAGKKSWSSFSKKNKSCPRKEINHSTLCALSENSVYTVLMLNMDLTRIWAYWRNVGQSGCTCIGGMGMESFHSNNNPTDMECRLTKWAGLSVCINSCSHHNDPPEQVAVITSFYSWGNQGREVKLFV